MMGVQNRATMAPELVGITECFLNCLTLPSSCLLLGFFVPDVISLQNGIDHPNDSRRDYWSTLV